jgi:hypothetical protein
MQEILDTIAFGERKEEAEVAMAGTSRRIRVRQLSRATSYCQAFDGGSHFTSRWNNVTAVQDTGMTRSLLPHSSCVSYHLFTTHEFLLPKDLKTPSSVTRTLSELNELPLITSAAPRQRGTTRVASEVNIPQQRRVTLADGRMTAKHPLTAPNNTIQ